MDGTCKEEDSITWSSHPGSGLVGYVASLDKTPALHNGKGP